MQAVCSSVTGIVWQERSYPGSFEELGETKADFFPNRVKGALHLCRHSVYIHMHTYTHVDKVYKQENYTASSSTSLSIETLIYFNQLKRISEVLECRRQDRAGAVRESV